VDQNNIRKVECIIGIDPDCEKSGLAVYLPATNKMLTCCLPFCDLIDQVLGWVENYDTTVVVEAGWKNKSNWHLDNCNKRQAAAIGNAVGRNHETGRKIIELRRHYGVDVYEQQPYVKTWRGKDRKITHEEIIQLLDNNGVEYFFKRTNPEVRDAILLALLQANKPLTIKL
jgi:hypothetical protein